MVFLLRRFESLFDDHHGSVDCFSADHFPFGALRAGNWSQNIIRGVHPTRWPTDSYPNADKFGGAQCFVNISKTVMTAVATTAFESNCSHRQVKVIVDDNHPLRWGLVVAGKPRDGPARGVHISSGKRKHNASPRDSGHLTEGFQSLERHRGLARPLAHHILTHVVTSVGVLLAGVSQPDDEPGGGVTSARLIASEKQRLLLGGVVGGLGVATGLSLASLTSLTVSFRSLLVSRSAGQNNREDKGVRVANEH